MNLNKNRQVLTKCPVQVESYQRLKKCPKMNVMARLEYELAYYDSAVHRFNNYTTMTPPPLFTFSISPEIFNLWMNFVCLFKRLIWFYQSALICLTPFNFHEYPTESFSRNTFNYWFPAVVALYGWPTRQTNPLSVLARNQTKDFWTWNLAVSGSGKGTRKRVGWRKELIGSWRRDSREASQQKSWRGTTDRCGRLRRQ